MPHFPAPDETSLFYRDWGAGRPVVFVHGMLMSSDMWQHQMRHLTENGSAPSPTTAAVMAGPMTPAPDTISTPSLATWPHCSTGSTSLASPWSGTRWAAARSRVT